jgi:hypothetical protein
MRTFGPLYRSGRHGAVDSVARHVLLQDRSHGVLATRFVAAAQLGPAFRFRCRSAFRRLEYITQIADGSNWGFPPPTSNGAPKTYDLGIDGALFDCRFRAPNRFFYRSSRQRLQSVPHEKLHETKLPHRELQRLFAPPDADRFVVEQKIADDDQILL